MVYSIVSLSRRGQQETGDALTLESPPSPQLLPRPDSVGDEDVETLGTSPRRPSSAQTPSGRRRKRSRTRRHRDSLKTKNDTLESAESGFRSEPEMVQEEVRDNGDETTEPTGILSDSGVNPHPPSIRKVVKAKRSIIDQHESIGVHEQRLSDGESGVETPQRPDIKRVRVSDTPEISKTAMEKFEASESVLSNVDVDEEQRPRTPPSQTGVSQTALFF